MTVIFAIIGFIIIIMVIIIIITKHNNDRRSRSNAVLCKSFTWQMVNTGVIWWLWVIGPYSHIQIHSKTLKGGIKKYFIS